jgi:hypothetical protein
MDRGLGRMILLALAGLLVLGLLGAWLIKTLFALAGYLVIGLLMVAAGMYLYGKVKTALRQPRGRGLPRR